MTAPARETQNDVIITVDTQPTRTSLSPFLRKIVSEGIIPEKIAFIFNQLPSTTLQSEALNQLREKVPGLAEQIVLDMKKIGSEESNFSNDVLPWWLFYPYSGKIKTKIRNFANTLENKFSFRWMSLLKALKIELASIPKHKMAKYLGLFVGLYVAILSVLKASDWIVKKAVIISHENAPNSETASTESVKRTKSQTEENEERKTSLVGEDQYGIPNNLRYRRISRGKYSIRWSSMGKDVRYHLYSSSSENQRDIRRENSSPLTQNSFEWSIEPGDYWVSVTAIGQDGHQTEHSSPLHLKVR